jgi:hypothetical protein
VQEYNINPHIKLHTKTNSITRKKPKYPIPKIQLIDKYKNLFKGIHLYEAKTESLIYVIKDTEFLNNHILVTGLPPKNNISKFKKIIAIRPHDIRLTLALFNLNLNLNLAIYKAINPYYFNPYKTTIQSYTFSILDKTPPILKKYMKHLLL